MYNNTITFDPTVGTPYGVNLTINTGASFDSTFKVLNNDKTNYNLEGWSGSSQMTKSVSVGSSMPISATFEVGITSGAKGEFKISLPASQTRNLKNGRYVFNILMTGTQVSETVLETSVSAGNTVGVGSTTILLNKISNVSIGDSVSIGSSINDASVVSVASTTKTITIGTASTINLEIVPGTAVTFTRTGVASTIYEMVSGNILVQTGVSSAP